VFSCVVRVRVAVPTTFPAIAVFPVLNVMKVEIIVFVPLNVERHLFSPCWKVPEVESEYDGVRRIFRPIVHILESFTSR